MSDDDRRIVEDPFDEPAPRPQAHARPAPRRAEEPPPYEPVPEKPPEDPVDIPPDALSADTLQALIEEFVTRHGTDLADAGDKVEQVRRLLKNGKVKIVFDPNTETANIVSVK